MNMMNMGMNNSAWNENKQQKDVQFGDEFIGHILTATKKINSIIGSTLGPKGMYIAFEKDDKTFLVNDGVTAIEHLKNIKSFFKSEKLIINLILDVAKKANLQSGDGTTTAVILSTVLLQSFFKHVKNRKKFVKYAVLKLLQDKINEIIVKLTDYTVKVETIEEIRNVAIISSKSSIIGGLISKAISKIGKHPI